VFVAAEASGATLLFDEADALFGRRRAEVKDAHDRYANLETSYLLQRLEAHHGLVLLTSNSPQSIDAAFFRRFGFAVDFGRPGRDERRRLWALHTARVAGRRGRRQLSRKSLRARRRRHRERLLRRDPGRCGRWRTPFICGTSSSPGGASSSRAADL
jgi:SpoVK/Ycf46/Vps4 family AAA+-type ATPase